MKPNFWNKTHDFIEKHDLIYLLAVVSGEGSAPNRVGAKMIVSKDDAFGTIGGGRSEHMIVEKAQQYLIENKQICEIAKLKHVDDNAPDSSGMICSGSQSYALVSLTKKDLATIEHIQDLFSKKQKAQLILSNLGLSLETNINADGQFIFENKQDNEWSFKEIIGVIDQLYIVGGGHCSLALSKLMTGLGFHVTVYENREGIQSYDENTFANDKHIIDYNKLPNIISDGDHTYITIMTYGHKHDQYVLESLIGKKVKYLGMMGSVSKVKSVYRNLREKGIDSQLFSSVHAPIGIDIHSNTPEEIAISIAAEIIKIKNSNLKE